MSGPLITSLIPAPGWHARVVNPDTTQPELEPLVGFGLTSEGVVVGLLAGPHGEVKPTSECEHFIELCHTSQGTRVPQAKFRSWKIQG